MGEAFVGTAFANVDTFSAPLQGFVSRNSWGKSWCREGLDLKTRRMTLAEAVCRGRPGKPGTIQIVHQGCRTST
jgi:4-carboxymuconolactone decarboxylase